MTTYTVKIEACNTDGTIWQAMHPAEQIDADSVRDAAEAVATNQTIAEGGGWRVLVFLDAADAMASGVLDAGGYRECCVGICADHGWICEVDIAEHSGQHECSQCPQRRAAAARAVVREEARLRALVDITPDVD